MIYALIEHEHGELKESSFEVLTAAGKLGSSLSVGVEAVVIGADAQSMADKLKEYGASKVHHIAGSRFEQYAPEAFGKSVVQLIESKSPSALIGYGSDRGNELMAHVAARLKQPMSANCTEISANGSDYKVVRQRWGGSLLEDATLKGSIKLLTLAPHTVVPETASASAVEVETFTPTLEEKDFRVQVSELIQSENQGVSLKDAKVVVGGGRGVGGEKSFDILEQLAALMNGAVGGSRVATNNGWRPHSDQIGQTGQQIAPELYIACRISGAIQHIVGCKGSKRSMAINTDADAPIMARADYAVIGDLHEIVPALIEEIKKSQG